MFAVQQTQIGLTHSLNMLSISRHHLFVVKMALSKDDIRLARTVSPGGEDPPADPAALAGFPGITIADAYAIQKAWVEIKLAEGRRQRPQDRPDLEGDAERAQYRRAGFRRAARRHVLCRWRPRPDRPLYRHARRGRARLRHEQRLAGPDCTMFDVLNATDFVVPALEILDTRIERVDPGPRRREKSSTPSPTTRRMPASCSADVRSARWTPTCAGSARLLQ